MKAAADEAPEPVDFDALNAALGAATDPPSAPEPGDETPPEEDHEPDHGHGDGTLKVGESQGRSSATYASSRPHTIPPSAAPVEDPSIPAVIVATEDTVPSAPPQMTVPVGSPTSAPQLAAAPPAPAVAPAAAQVPFPSTPAPFPIKDIPRRPTVAMPDRPRRPRTPTVVVRRSRGPSTSQMLLIFAGMMVVFVAAGITVIEFRPRWLGIGEAAPAPSASTPAATAPAPSTTMSGAPTASVAPATSVAPKPTSGGHKHGGGPR